MPWRIAPGTGYCEVGGELVFLDLARDKYLALRGEDRAAFERLRNAEPNDSEAMSRLVQTGFLARADARPCLEPASIEIPTQDISAFDDRRFTIRMAVASATALRWAGRAMRPGRIAATVEGLRVTKAHIGVPGADTPAAAIASHYASCRWAIPVTPRCLIDALALDRILLSRGLVASMVFGVQLDPFRAHCWLQTPERVLTGTAAEARAFTPILVVG